MSKVMAQRSLLGCLQRFLASKQAGGIVYCFRIGYSQGVAALQQEQGALRGEE